MISTIPGFTIFEYAFNFKLNIYSKVTNPGIVDIMPTLAHILNITIPAKNAMEIDGISLIDPVSLFDPQINIFQQKLDVSWKSIDKTGYVKIWMSTKNEYADIGKEDYILIGEVPISQHSAFLDISKYASNFYKVALEGKYNTVNKWFTMVK